MFRIGMIPTVNKPTRVTKQTASKVNHIITSSIIHTGFKSGIVKADIFDHFPFYFLFCKYILHIGLLYDQCFPVAGKSTSPLGLQEVSKRSSKEIRNYMKNF